MCELVAPDRRTPSHPVGSASPTAPGMRCSPRTSAGGPRTGGAGPAQSPTKVDWLDPAGVPGIVPAEPGRPRRIGAGDHHPARTRRSRRTTDLARLPGACGPLLRRAEPPGSPWDQPNVALLEVGLHPSADDARRPCRAPIRRRRRLPPGTGLAGVLRRCRLPPTRIAVEVDRPRGRHRLQRDTGKTADDRLAAWKAGRTGFPYIDAGMRQLLAEGWVHNRVRMGVASFLIKDLHLPWQVGAAHFLEHLVDGDYASNNHGWQWVAGSGTAGGRVLPHLQPDRPGREVRSRRRLRPAFRARTACHSGQGGAPAVGAARRRPPITRSRSSTMPPSGRSRCAAGSPAARELIQAACRRQKPTGRRPHDADQLSPGSSQRRPSPVLKALTAQVIGSIATALRWLRLARSGEVRRRDRPAPSRRPHRPRAPGRSPSGAVQPMLDPAARHRNPVSATSRSSSASRTPDRRSFGVPSTVSPRDRDQLLVGPRGTRCRTR